MAQAKQPPKGSKAMRLAHLFRTLERLQRVPSPWGVSYHILRRHVHVLAISCPTQSGGERLAPIPVFEEAHLRAVCDVLGDTHLGLTNTEIDRLLAECGIEVTRPKEDRYVVVLGANKRDRLFGILERRQRQDRCGNHVAAFIKAAMAPVRYTANPQLYEDRRARLNTALAFAGYQLGANGELHVITPSTTLTEAQERADRLRGELRRRGVHPGVLEFCREELLVEDYFHATLEATKSVAEKMRKRTGLTLDGNGLVEEACGFEKRRPPLLAFNTLSTPQEESEHRGLASLVKGLFSAFRNPTAHAPRIHWPISEQDALDVLTLVSLIHRRLDNALVYPIREP